VIILNTVFNILDYGAINDGKTICTGAIQKAINDASVCQGKVIIPPGELSMFSET